MIIYMFGFKLFLKQSRFYSKFPVHIYKDRYLYKVTIAYVGDVWFWFLWISLDTLYCIHHTHVIWNCTTSVGIGKVQPVNQVNQIRWVAVVTPNGSPGSVCNRWLVVLRINVDLAIFQPYLDLEAGDNQSLKIQVARPGITTAPCKRLVSNV